MTTKSKMSWSEALRRVIEARQDGCFTYTAELREALDVVCANPQTQPTADKPTERRA